MRTVLDAIHVGMQACEEANVFLGHGTDSLWDEVLVLVLYAIGETLQSDPLILEKTLNESEQAAVNTLLKARIEKKIPASYLINEAWFAGLSFYVDERVIIPRSPIAELIEVGFAPWIDPDRVSSVLDMCTGSGCMAIACAYAFPEAMIDAVDLSKDALAVAKINVDRHGKGDQVCLIHSDLFQAVPLKKYDIIVSNPPYVSDIEMQGLPAEFTHEPEMALAAEDEGLALAIQIVHNAKHYLKPEGVLIVEVGNSAEAMHRRFPHWPFVWLDFERGGDGVFLLMAKDL